MDDANANEKAKGQAGEAPQNEPNRTASKAEGERELIEQDIEEKERKGEL